MNSKVFENANIKGKLLICMFLSEFEHTLTFKFFPSVKPYLMVKYKKLYKPYLSNILGDPEFFAEISRVWEKEEVISVYIKIKSSDHASTVDFRKPWHKDYPDGMKIDIPIRFINNLNLIL